MWLWGLTRLGINPIFDAANGVGGAGFDGIAGHSVCAAAWAAELNPERALRVNETVRGTIVLADVPAPGQSAWAHRLPGVLLDVELNR